MASSASGQVVGDWGRHDRIPLSHKKTCDFCCQRKRKCDGDGQGSCSFCKARGTNCHYSSRRPNRPRASSTSTSSSLVEGGGGRGSSEGLGSDTISVAGVNRIGKRGWLGKRVVTKPRTPAALAALKRPRLGPSPATGLVHTRENVFLGTFFDALGFLPLVDESQIRQAILELMLAPRGARATEDRQAAARGVRQRSSESSTESAITVAPSSPRVGTGAGAGPGGIEQAGGSALKCTLWCAIAIGGLVQGQPPRTVFPYARLAWTALSRCSQQNTAEAARAYMMMGYLFNFLRDDVNFCKFLRFAVSIVDGLGPEEAAKVQDMGVVLMKGDETRSYHTAEQCPWDMNDYRMEMQPAAQVPTFIVKKTLCNFLVEADRRMYAAFLKDQKELLFPPEPDKTSPSDAPQSGQNVHGQAVGGRAGLGHGGGSGSGRGGEGGGRGGGSKASGKEPPGRQQSNSWNVIQDWIPLFTRMEEAAELPEIGNGIGGLMYNGAHAYIEMAAGNTMVGFLKIIKTANVLIRYPGLCRFSVWLHLSHCLLAFLSAFKVEETFGKLRDAYNMTRAEGTAAVPTFSEWTSIGFCNHIFCRAIDDRLQKKTKQAVEVNHEGEEINSEDQQQHPQQRFQNQPQSTTPERHQHQHQQHQGIHSPPDQHLHHRKGDAHRATEGGAHRATPSPPPLPSQASIPHEAVSAQGLSDQTVPRSCRNEAVSAQSLSEQTLPRNYRNEATSAQGFSERTVPKSYRGEAISAQGLSDQALPRTYQNEAISTQKVSDQTVPRSYRNEAVAAQGLSDQTVPRIYGDEAVPAKDVSDQRSHQPLRQVQGLRSPQPLHRGGDEGGNAVENASNPTYAAVLPDDYVSEAFPPVSYSGLPAGCVVEPSPPGSSSGLASDGGDGQLVSWANEVTPLSPVAMGQTSAAAAVAKETGTAATVPATVPAQGFLGGASYDVIAVSGDTDAGGDTFGDGGGGGVGGDVTTADAAGGWGGASRSREIGGRDCRSREAAGPRDTFGSDWKDSGTEKGW